MTNIYLGCIPDNTLTTGLVSSSGFVLYRLWWFVLLLLWLLRGLSLLSLAPRVMVLLPELRTSLLLSLIRVHRVHTVILTLTWKGLSTVSSCKRVKTEMELTEDGSFDLRGFSPHSLTFLPNINCLLATEKSGGARCLDLTSGAELLSTGTQRPTPTHSPHVRIKPQG